MPNQFWFEFVVKISNFEISIWWIINYNRDEIQWENKYLMNKAQRLTCPNLLDKSVEQMYFCTNSTLYEINCELFHGCQELVSISNWPQILQSLSITNAGVCKRNRLPPLWQRQIPYDWRTQVLGKPRCVCSLSNWCVGWKIRKKSKYEMKFKFWLYCEMFMW